MDTVELARGYAALLETAQSGPYGAPPAGEWSREQILAHVALNDDLLIAATRAVLAGEPAAVDNARAVDTAELDRFLAALPDRAALIPLVRERGRTLAELATHLTPELGAALIPLRILDGATVRVDRPVPWLAALQTHARVHLPLHTAQLKALLDVPALTAFD